jgi:hypothetical protein
MQGMMLMQGGSLQQSMETVRSLPMMQTMGPGGGQMMEVSGYASPMSYAVPAHLQGPPMTYMQQPVLG